MLRPKSRSDRTRARAADGLMVGGLRPASPSTWNLTEFTGVYETILNPPPEATPTTGNSQANSTPTSTWNTTNNPLPDVQRRGVGTSSMWWS